MFSSWDGRCPDDPREVTNKDTKKEEEIGLSFSQALSISCGAADSRPIYDAIATSIANQLEIKKLRDYLTSQDRVLDSKIKQQLGNLLVYAQLAYQSYAKQYFNQKPRFLDLLTEALQLTNEIINMPVIKAKITNGPNTNQNSNETASATLAKISGQSLADAKDKVFKLVRKAQQLQCNYNTNKIEAFVNIYLGFAGILLSVVFSMPTGGLSLLGLVPSVGLLARSGLFMAKRTQKDSSDGLKDVSDTLLDRVVIKS